jgi:hypothetical protein
MAVGNRIELKKIKLEPVSKMATAATALDRVHADMQAVVKRYNARMIQKREQINAALGAIPICVRITRAGCSAGGRK